MMKRTISHGFTLIEILVALVILGVALTSISYTISLNSRNAAYIDSKTSAHWVAMNVISQYQLEASQKSFNDRTSEEGSNIMLNKTWYWSSEMNSTVVPKMYLVKVDVSAAPRGKSIEHLEAYIYSGIPTRE